MSFTIFEEQEASKIAQALYLSTAKPEKLIDDLDLMQPAVVEGVYRNLGRAFKEGFILFCIPCYMGFMVFVMLPLLFIWPDLVYTTSMMIFALTVSSLLLGIVFCLFFGGILIFIFYGYGSYFHILMKAHSALLLRKEEF